MNTGLEINFQKMTPIIHLPEVRKREVSDILLSYLGIIILFIFSYLTFAVKAMGNFVTNYRSNSTVIQKSTEEKY